METTFTASGYGCGNYNYGDKFCDLEVGIGDIKARIADSTGNIFQRIGTMEAGVLDKLGSISLAEFKDRSDIAQRQSTAMNSFERDVQNRVHENREIIVRELGDQTYKILQNNHEDHNDLKNGLNSIQLEASKNTATILLDNAKNTSALMLENNKNTEAILAKLNTDNVARLTDQINELRYENERGRWMNGLANQNQEISSLKQMLNSVEQNQRFGSKTVQFGSGNVADTKQQANQAWTEYPIKVESEAKDDPNDTDINNLPDIHINDNSGDIYINVDKDNEVVKYKKPKVSEGLKAILSVMGI